MTKVERVLLVQRKSDDKFLWLKTGRNTSTWGYTSDPLEATRIKPHDKDHLENPKEASYYFENSARARGWVEGCVMVPYKIITTTFAYEILKGRGVCTTKAKR